MDRRDFLLAGVAAGAGGAAAKLIERVPLIETVRTIERPKVVLAHVENVIPADMHFVPYRVSWALMGVAYRGGEPPAISREMNAHPYAFNFSKEIFALAPGDIMQLRIIRRSGK